MVGITSFGGYIPRYRMNKMLAYGAMGWLNPANIMNARGERTVAGFDEDALTMAVAASMNCIAGNDREAIDGVFLASTTAPYAERLNAAILACALNTRENIRAADFGGSLRSGTSALICALEAVGSSGSNSILVSGSDCRLGKPGSVQEMVFGDGAASVTVGHSGIIAEYMGSFSITQDFTDHFRGCGSKYDRQWEERWIRDMGYEKIIPAAIEGLCSKCEIKTEDFSRVIYPCYYGGARKSINKRFGFTDAVLADEMSSQVGDTGSAHPLLMLARSLEEAKPGDLILLLGYGSGCDALCFRATDKTRETVRNKSIESLLGNKIDLDNYQKYLVWRDMAEADIGLRGEDDQPTRWSLAWRNRKLILGFEGTVCKACGTQQFPAQRVCVNPECGAIDEMERVCLSDKGGKIFSYTSDMLAATINPPAIYGNVEFNGGGRLNMDFTDCTLNDLAVGKPVEFSFRIKLRDAKRGITNYFWKAVPVDR